VTVLGVLGLAAVLVVALVLVLRRQRRSRPSRRPARSAPPRRRSSDCPSGKVAYSSLADAWAAVHANQERYAQGRVRYRLVRPYECDLCGRAHTTSKPLRF
jgi:hypothetical protein